MYTPPLISANEFAVIVLLLAVVCGIAAWCIDPIARRLDASRYARLTRRIYAKR